MTSAGDTTLHPFRLLHSRFGAVAALALVALILTGCGSNNTRQYDVVGETVQTPPDAPLGPQRSDVVRQAEQLLGTPYRYGGSSPRGFDCSGLVQYTHAQAGVRVPRVARAQHRDARRVPMHSLKPGDLVFFRLAGKTDHVGIYVGNGAFIHAPSSGKQVSRARLDSVYWRPRLVGAGSYLTASQ